MGQVEKPLDPCSMCVIFLFGRHPSLTGGSLKFGGSLSEVAGFLFGVHPSGVRYFETHTHTRRFIHCPTQPALHAASLDHSQAAACRPMSSKVAAHVSLIHTPWAKMHKGQTRALNPATPAKSWFFNCISKVPSPKRCDTPFQALVTSRSSTREVRIRVPFSSVVYLVDENPPPKKG